MIRTQLCILISCEHFLYTSDTQVVSFMKLDSRKILEFVFP